mmetsp:Transcript_22041/g.36479  ORF Transcript_22041/g.36479 Transcript_22041/m.36479 type:complete len:267 (+) Transcript_22041:610-1410(+)
MYVCYSTLTSHCYPPLVSCDSRRFLLLPQLSWLLHSSGVVSFHKLCALFFWFRFLGFLGFLGCHAHALVTLLVFHLVFRFFRGILGIVVVSINGIITTVLAGSLLVWSPTVIIIVAIAAVLAGTLARYLIIVVTVTVTTTTILANSRARTTIIVTIVVVISTLGIWFLIVIIVTAVISTFRFLVFPLLAATPTTIIKVGISRRKFDCWSRRRSISRKGDQRSRGRLSFWNRSYRWRLWGRFVRLWCWLWCWLWCRTGRFHCYCCRQ